MTKSLNQIAQEEGDSSQNEANRIRAREAAVKQAWRQIAFDQDRNPTTEEMIKALRDHNLGATYIQTICERNGYELS